MDISFLENGLDSLKKGYDSLQSYENIYYLTPNEIEEKNRFFLLKDAVLGIQHGVEILLKYVLVKENEFLIFSSIDKYVKIAYKEKRSRKLNSVFQTTVAFKLHTINFSETVDRLENIVGLKFTNKFKDKLVQIENFRNQIMHSEVFLFETQLHLLFDGFIDELDMILLRSLGKEYKTMSGYSELIKSHKEYEKDLEEKKSSLRNKILKCFLEIFKKIGIGMGENEVKHITDINAATEIIKMLFDNGFSFGTDIYNGWSSGNVSSLKRIDNGRFSMFTKDNEGEFIFKFKSLIVYLPSFKDMKSPIIFFESDIDTVEEELRDYVIDDDGIRHIEGIGFYDNRPTIFEKEEVSAFYDEEGNSYSTEYYTINRFLTKGIFGFINIQHIGYNDIRRILWKFKEMDGKRFQVLLQKIMKK